MKSSIATAGHSWKSCGRTRLGSKSGDGARWFAARIVRFRHARCPGRRIAGRDRKCDEHDRREDKRPQGLPQLFVAARAHARR